MATQLPANVMNQIMQSNPNRLSSIVPMASTSALIRAGANNQGVDRLNRTDLRNQANAANASAGAKVYTPGSGGFLADMNDQWQNGLRFIGTGIDNALDDGIGNGVESLFGTEAGKRAKDLFSGDTYATALDVASDIALFSNPYTAALGLGKVAARNARNIAEAIQGVDSLTGEDLSGAQRLAKAGVSALDLGLSAIPGVGAVKNLGRGVADKAGYDLAKAGIDDATKSRTIFENLKNGINDVKAGQKGIDDSIGALRELGYDISSPQKLADAGLSSDSAQAAIGQTRDRLLSESAKKNHVKIAKLPDVKKLDQDTVNSFNEMAQRNGLRISDDGLLEMYDVNSGAWSDASTWDKAQVKDALKEIDSMVNGKDGIIDAQNQILSNERRGINQRGDSRIASEPDFEDTFNSIEANRVNSALDAIRKGDTKTPEGLAFNDAVDQRITDLTNNINNLEKQARIAGEETWSMDNLLDNLFNKEKAKRALPFSGFNESVDDVAQKAYDARDHAARMKEIGKAVGGKEGRRYEKAAKRLLKESGSESKINRNAARAAREDARYGSSSAAEEAYMQLAKEFEKNPGAWESLDEGQKKSITKALDKLAKPSDSSEMRANLLTGLIGNGAGAVVGAPLSAYAYGNYDTMSDALDAVYRNPDGSVNMGAALGMMFPVGRGRLARRYTPSWSGQRIPMNAVDAAIPRAAIAGNTALSSGRHYGDYIDTENEDSYNNILNALLSTNVAGYRPVGYISSSNKYAK